MKQLLLAAVLLASAPLLASAQSELSPESIAALKTLAEWKAAFKENPCEQNHQWNFFELLVEAAPAYSTASPVPGAPPASVILTMDKCEVLLRDHVEGKPMTPTAERTYTEGDFGLILTTTLNSDTTWITVIAKHNGAWVTTGQLGKFSNMGLFDTFYEAKATIKLAHYEQGGKLLPYKMTAAFRPSWSR